MKTPTGFVAICRCGRIVGALSYGRTNRSEAGEILGQWLNNGYTVELRFDDAWSVAIQACTCEERQK